MNHYTGLQGLVETRRERGNGLPLGGQYTRMELAIEPERGRPLGQRLGKPGRRILGDTGKWTEAREEDARSCHAVGLNLGPSREGSDFTRCGYSASLMPARRPSSWAAAAGVISPARTLPSNSWKWRGGGVPPLQGGGRGGSTNSP